MITSRPKPTALFSLSMFIAISLFLAYLGINNVVESGQWYWYSYIAVYFFGSLAFIISIRVLIKFKVLYISKGYVDLWRPLSRRRYQLREMEYWKETTVKTGRTLYKELEMNFLKKKIKISNQENTSYNEVFNYLRNKAGKKYVS